MSSNNQSTLLTWIAKQNDPFGREGLPGPNLTLLFDPASPYAGEIDEVVVFFRDAPGGDGEERRKAHALEAEIRKRSARIQVALRPWRGEDPTSHAEILDYLRREIPRIRADRPGKRLVAHVSPGTPSMQTVWVLMAETGMIEPPVELAKSCRPGERADGRAAVRMEVGLDTFFKIYQRNQLLRRPEQEAVEWDPRKFRSARLKQAYAEARRFAQVKVPLLILGERGTGKTTLAAWVRSFGPYRKPGNDAHPPVVPCGQYVEETMRAELFGYVKGAFTDAKETKPGLLEAADGDTLFLDEIGDVAPGLQRLLIKALEEHVYSPLGSTKTKRSDFRLISATNRPLSELKSKLDPDFFDRIGLLRIEMPPLRDVREDLPWIWDSVAAKAQVRAGVALRVDDLGALRAAVVDAARSHPLPGNLRDLFVVAYRAIAALGDAHEPMPLGDAIAYALAGLEASESIDREDATGQVLRGCLGGTSIDALLADGPLSTKAVLRDLQRYMARQIRQYARKHRADFADVCDVKERALRIWAAED
jgi:DNA-binding NtrC family response regulator